jgi:hypothetical protein
MEIMRLAKLGELADQQFGLVTRQQASLVGVQLDELIESGFAEWILGEVFRLRAGGRSSFPRLYAAWLHLVPASPAAQRSPPSDGVVSHDAALRLYQVAGEAGPSAEFTIPAGFPANAEPSTALHIGELTPGEWRYVAGLPVTEPGRTLVDLTGRYDIDELARMAASLVRRQWITESGLRAALANALERQPQPGNTEQWIDAVLAEVGLS